MKRLVVCSVLFVFLPGTVNGEVALLVVGNSAYIIESSESGMLTLRALDVDKVWIDGVDPPDPPTTNISIKAEEISKRLLQSKLEAIALASVINRLSRNDVDQTKLREALDVSIDTLSKSGLFKGNKFKVWKTEILGLGNLSSSMLKQVDIGIRKAFGITLVSGKVMDWLMPMQASAVDGVERIDIGALIQLLQLIFKLLKDLGILNTLDSGLIRIPVSS